jgi:hypothetical protein
MVNDQTQFTRDVMGRYVCNTFAEALASGPFDVIIIGGGTFCLSLAQDLGHRLRRMVDADEIVQEPGFGTLSNKWNVTPRRSSFASREIGKWPRTQT